MSNRVRISLTVDDYGHGGTLGRLQSILYSKVIHDLDRVNGNLDPALRTQLALDIQLLRLLRSQIAAAFQSKMGHRTYWLPIVPFSSRSFHRIAMGESRTNLQHT